MKQLPTIPLRGVTVFPYTVLHFDVGRERSINALEEAMMDNQLVFLVTQKNSDTDLPTAKDFYEVGTIARVKQMLKLPGEAIRVLVEGVSRGQAKSVLQEHPYFKCEVEEMEEPDILTLSTKTDALARKAISKFEKYASASGNIPRELIGSLSFMDLPGRIADFIISQLDVRAEVRQKALEIIDYDKRLTYVTKVLAKEIEILKLEKDIDNKVRQEINKHQKEYYLKEQIRVIQEELGEDDEDEKEIQGYYKKLKKLKLSPRVTKKIEKEIGRLEKMGPYSSETSVVRTYVEWVLELPWGKKSKEEVDIKAAEKILNEDHYGLEKVKERVLEYMAVMKLSDADMKGSIICLVGPPGVGKTSIAKSIAKSLNRAFARMSLGGVRDEAEIRGHRRTYVGAIPGRIMSAIKESESMNPVFLFDEIDKLGNDFRGDPASALLEVLDPEQNKEFMDHYLEVPFDLSKVMFITTANSTETIPRPLLDRMEIIPVSGYTEEEKLNIAQKYLVSKKLKEHGLTEKDIVISEEAIRDIINYYTRESGVRSLEREIAKICRKVARKVAEKKRAQIKITPGKLEEYLGKKKFRYDKVNSDNEIGVVTGMAWTAVGGDTLSIETTIMEGTGKVLLTGQLGEVMQESAKAGISYIRANAKELGIEQPFYKKSDMHIHIPEGATPKDGPSAGVTMCTSVVSALTKVPVRNDVAMTGEITLRGKVLPVGGIKEKVLAAHRAGIKKILLPMENERDLDEIPDNVKKELEFVLVEGIDQVLVHALVKDKSKAKVAVEKK